jgi:hypothetical protein
MFTNQGGMRVLEFLMLFVYSLELFNFANEILFLLFKLQLLFFNSFNEPLDFDYIFLS